MIRVENLESNTVQQFENDVEYINLTEQSKIYFDYSASDVASSVREGDDLVLTFVDGVVVRINQYYDFVEDTAFIFFVDEAGIITPWVSGLLIASGVALIAGGSSDAAAAAEDAALAVIAAYAADNTNPAPTEADYAAAGVTGVTAANLADVNAAVDATDAAGADTTPEVQALVDAVPAATIDLSGTDFGGQLINPIQVLIDGETRTFYFWDRNGDGVASSASVGAVTDYVNHDELDTLFNGGLDTTNDIAARSFTMADGTVLRLPTLGTTVGRDVDLDEVVSSPTENQTVLDDLAAIKDAFDGTGTGSGVPTGWVSGNYWSATSTGAGSHARLFLSNGYSNSGSDGHGYYVALEVV